MTSMNPQLWLDDQQRAFRTPSHSEERLLQQAVISAQSRDTSFSLPKKKNHNQTQRKMDE